MILYPHHEKVKEKCMFYPSLLANLQDILKIVWWYPSGFGKVNELARVLQVKSARHLY